MAEFDDTDIKVDIGVLKTQVLTLSALCNKMDQVIEKLVDQHDRHIAKVYTDMDNRRLETEADIKEIHQRIDTVLDKMETSNKEIMEEFKKWYTLSYGRGNIPQAKELHDFMDKRYGTYKKCWQNVALIYDENNGEIEEGDIVE